MYNRWLIAFACGWVNLFIFAIFRSAGILYLALIDQFQCSYQQAAWPVSLAGSVASTTGIVSGFLSHYFAARTLVILGVIICSLSVIATYFAQSINFVTICIGLAQGIGIGFVTNLLPAVLNAHFEDKKAIALGISYAGSTLGAVIFPVVIQSLLAYYGFHDAMLLIGGLVMNGVIGGMILRYPKKEPSEEANTTEPPPIVPLITEQRNSNIVQYSGETVTLTVQETSKVRSFFQNLKTNLKRDFKLLYNFYFLICTFTYINFILDFVAFIIILPDVAKDQGIPDVDSKWLLSIFSITDFVGRIGPGWLSYWKIISDKSIYVLSITIMGICMIWLILVQTWLQFVLVSLLCGLVTGCQMVLSPAILADYLGTENTAVTFGMANFICGLMTLVTRPMIIGVKDIYGDYKMLGYVLSCCALLSGALWAVEIVYRRLARPASLSSPHSS